MVPNSAQGFVIRHQGEAGYVLLASCAGDDTGGGLFSFDGRDVERLDRLSSSGIAFGNNRFLRLLLCPGDDASGGELLLYDPRGVERYYRIDALKDCHELLWDGEAFVIVSTGTNSILWVSPSGEILRQWQAPGERDSWHLNSLFLRDGELFVSAFGRFRKHREWAEHKCDGSGIVMSLATGKDILAGLSCPHSPKFMDGAWIVCNSATQELVQIEESTGAIRRRLQLGGWTRGVAVSDDLLFVGESANRHVPKANDRASIAVICRKTWNLLDRIELPCREISDLLLAPSSFLEGVRIGFRTNPRRVVEQEQYALFRQVGVEPVRLWATGDPLPREACKVKIEGNIPSVLEADALAEFECRLENLGSAFLVSAPPNPVHISYKWLDERFKRPIEGTEGLRTRLLEALAPHEARTCRIRVVGPPVEGHVILRLTLVQEHVAWFDDLDESNSWSQLVRIVKPGSGGPIAAGPTTATPISKTR
jgi:acetolactate synthase-1/2/3 large subunit